MTLASFSLRLAWHGMTGGQRAWAAEEARAAAYWHTQRPGGTNGAEEGWAAHHTQGFARVSGTLSQGRSPGKEREAETR